MNINELSDFSTINHAWVGKSLRQALSNIVAEEIIILFNMTPAPDAVHLANIHRLWQSDRPLMAEPCGDIENNYFLDAIITGPLPMRCRFGSCGCLLSRDGAVYFYHD